MMYYKINESGQTVFSDCATILMPNRMWVSNPSEEQILEAGWQVYIPPPVVPIPEEEPGYDQVMEAVKKMLKSSAEELSDEDALDVAALFPTWVSRIGTPVSVGERLWYDGKLYKVIQAHTPQTDWTPDATPSLYAEVSIAEIPDWIRPISAETAYHIGDRVKHNDKTWESAVDNNVWEPGAVGTENLWAQIN